ncbi:hypothetical protein GOP47_0012972 [Adiantum capillus-veneris]|uniref:Uncharacterized protein n=1 Tax=Adiantum capillus-veneris TaxID=13818 RepID=A0A9D4ZHB2_ADICA|nr:hypothetical protein GOP47_0012972 [Adiantum capillus-veneris]
MRKPYTRGDARRFYEWSIMEEEKNKCSYQRVLQSFHRNCRREFLPVSGCRFHVKRLLRDLYHGHKYHGRFYVSRLDGWTTFVMGQVNILTVVLNVEHLEEVLSRAGKTLNETYTHSR